MSKKQNNGKVFEAEFKESVPPDYYYYRLKDMPKEYRGADNPCDYFLYKEPYLFMVELKSHKGKSLPLVKIRDSQLRGMYSAHFRPGVYAGFLINYRDLEETYWVSVAEVKRFIDRGSRKSIPVEWCREYGVLIPQIKKRVRYRYELAEWLGRYYVQKV